MTPDLVNIFSVGFDVIVAFVVANILRMHFSKIDKIETKVDQLQIDIMILKSELTKQGDK